jgi:hypothetical protein
MITPDTIKHLMSLDRFDIVRILDRSGYPMCAFEDAEFLGITESGDFCYTVSYYDEAGTGEAEQTRVYVRREKATGEIVAEF